MSIYSQRFLSDEERLRSNCDVPSDPEECWNYTGALMHRGYGNFWFRGTTYRAHRASYIIFKGEIPEGLYVLHKCHNRKCCNPNHLEVGTHADNMDDMKEADRAAKGSANGNSRLTEREVLEIAFKYYMGLGGVTAASLGHEYGVSKVTIGNIIHGKQWSSITGIERS